MPHVPHFWPRRRRRRSALFCKATIIDLSFSNAIGFYTAIEFLLGDKILLPGRDMCLQISVHGFSLSGIDLSLIPRGKIFQRIPRRYQPSQTKQHDLTAALLPGSDTSGMGASSLVTAISSLLRLRFLQDLCVASPLLSPALRVNGSGSLGYAAFEAATSLSRLCFRWLQAGTVDAHFVRCNSNRRSLSRCFRVLGSDMSGHEVSAIPYESSRIELQQLWHSLASNLVGDFNFSGPTWLYLLEDVCIVLTCHEFTELHSITCWGFDFAN